MSAYVLSDKHIFTIAKFCVLATPKGYTAPDVIELANILKGINIDSVNYRYNEKTRKTKCNPKEFEEVNPSNLSNKYKMIRLIKCWDYQACENNSNINYIITRGYLFSFFTTEEEEEAEKQNHLVWSI